MQHELSLVMFKIHGVLCPRTEKTLMEEGQGSASRSKQKEGQRDNNILFNNL